MSTVNSPSEWDGAHFGREESAGVILGLDIGQVVFMSVGIALAVPMVIAGGFPWGLAAAIGVVGVFGAIGLPRVGGRSIVHWVWVLATSNFRSWLGNAEYVQPMTEAQGEFRGGELVSLPIAQPVIDEQHLDKKGRIIVPKGHRFQLPGEFNELMVYTMPGGEAFIYDPSHREAIIVAQIETEKAFELEAFEEKEDRVRAWASAVSAIARIRGVSRVQCSDQTTIVTGSKVLEWYQYKQRTSASRSGDEIDPFLNASLTDLMLQAEGRPVHEMWVAVVLSRRALSKQIHANGRGIRGMMATALGVMATIEAAIPTAGVHVARWHSPRTVAGLIRSAFDPAASMEISERLGEAEGATVDSAGPMFASWTGEQMSSDGALHKTFKIAEWPQEQAALGFLDHFVFAGDFRHTVSLYFKPRDTEQGIKDTARRKSTWQSNETIRKRLGRPPSLRHSRQIEDIEREESELVSGHSPLRLIALITVTAATEDELEAAVGDLRNRAAAAGCSIRLMYGEQDSAFIASALPLGRLQ